MKVRVESYYFFGIENNFHLPKDGKEDIPHSFVFVEHLLRSGADATIQNKNCLKPSKMFDEITAKKTRFTTASKALKRQESFSENWGSLRRAVRRDSEEGREGVEQATRET